MDVIFATILRVGLLIYGSIQDKHPVLKYTDIDYSVFTDAAKFVTQFQSPYNRATYRYTPLLAWILIPNSFNLMFGKILFAVCDLLVGMIIVEILKSRRINRRWSYLWTLNPFVAVISTRGNAESILSFLVMASLYFIIKGWIKTSAVFFGLAVHFKIYPIIYAIPIWFGIDSHRGNTPQPFKLFSPRRALYGLIAGSTFMILNLIMYSIYGHQFLQETYLYHITRQDHRHNFSLYFLHMYLTTDMSTLGSILSFLPQLVLVVVLGLAYSNDLPFAWFLQTFAFVAFNKVCTSQVSWTN